MPELPEVEVLVRHLRPLLLGKTIREVEVRREKVVRPASPALLKRTLRGAIFKDVFRRGKYLLFELRPAGKRTRLPLIGHLGMTGRMYLLPSQSPLPKHAAVVFNLGRQKFVFEDTRYFGRVTLDASAIEHLGPEPLGNDFRVDDFAAALRRSRQAIKVKLLDQQLVAGVGNIYASEALFRAGISPRIAACRLTPKQVERLWKAIRETLLEAIECGSTVPLNYSGKGRRDGLFYFGRAENAPDYYEERLRVYDRRGKPCLNCGESIKRLVQTARSTYFCPKCQRS